MTDDPPADGEGGTDDRGGAASPEQIDRLAAEYRRVGQPFARVTVVRRKPPVSASVGDRALVTPDGDLTGWIGGVSCAQAVAVKEATAAIERGEPVLVGIAPDPADVARPGLEAYPMTCHSGGTLELFVEPVTAAPRLVVVGESPIARSLVRLAGETTFDVTVVTGPETDPDPAATPGADAAVTVSDEESVTAAVEGAAAVVVASVGEYDEAGLVAALRASVPYVGLVASETRRNEIAAPVADHLGVETDDVVTSVTTPAGLDIGAETPGEIAVSILAELVAVRRGATTVGDTAHSRGTEPDDTHEGNSGDGSAETAVDPVCGMDVTANDAAATVTHGGETYYFCGEGCAEAFTEDPERYTGEVMPGG